jgi:hypothetical protein
MYYKHIDRNQTLIQRALSSSSEHHGHRVRTMTDQVWGDYSVSCLRLRYLNLELVILKKLNSFLSKLATIIQHSCIL